MGYLAKRKFKFAKDEEWLELVNQGLCPVCLDQHNPRNRLLFKKGIKRECGQGHLEIYGNPEYLAYYRIKEKKKENNVCRTCSHKIVEYDKKHDEMICINSNCKSRGTVLSGPPQEHHGHWVRYPLGVRFDYSDVDATYSSYEDDRCDYGDYIPE